jgi:uncharacterized membrane protein YvbJ
MIWHVPNSEGTYIITITVKDLAGAEVKDTISIIVQERKGPDKEKLNFKSNAYIWIFLILVVIILILIFYLMIKRQKNNQGR